MKFYDTSNAHDSLVHYVLFKLGNITTTDFPLVDIARATNTAKANLALKVALTKDDWDFDDSANTDFPIATSSLVEGQQDYSLPTDILKLRRVEVKDVKGKWYRLIKIDDKEIEQATDEFLETDGRPTYYRIEAGSLFLYSAPTPTQVTLSGGIKIHFTREMDEFDASTTTTEIGFGGVGDKVVAFEVAEEWAETFRKDKMRGLKDRRVELENSYLANISQRSGDKNNRLRVATEDME